MRFPHRLLCSALACAALALSLPAGAEAPRPAAASEKPQPSAAPATAFTDEARPLFEKGIAAHDAHKLGEARDLFARAFEIKRSWDIAANLGIVEIELGDSAAAAEHLSFALRALPPSEADSTRTGLERKLAKVLPLVAKVTVRSPVQGALVRVAGEVKGTTPLDGPVFTKPGAVLVEVTKDGHERAFRYVAGTAGSAEEVTLAPAPHLPRVERSWTAPAVAFGFGGLGLLTAIVAGSLATARMSEIRSICGDDLVCPEKMRASADEGRTAAHFATAGAVVAGMGAAIGIGLLTLPWKRGPVQVGASVGPAFVGVKGAF